MPRTSGKRNDAALLEAALEGLQAQRKQVEGYIGQIRAALGQSIRGASGKNAAKRSTGGTRILSAAARKRIADAQKRRWAAYRKAASAGAEE
jgi:hypothetical protein